MYWRSIFVEASSIQICDSIHLPAIQFDCLHEYAEGRIPQTCEHLFTFQINS